MEKVLEATGDLKFSLAFEILPNFEVGSFDDMELERLIAEIPEEEVEQSSSDLAERNRTYEPREEGAAAQEGDKLTIDFVGRIGDEAFEGGTAEGVDLVLGSGPFIPGFEDQLEGAKAGESARSSVTFPADYQAAHLAGKEAIFDVKVKAVAAPDERRRRRSISPRNSASTDLEKLREAVQ